MTTKVKRPTKRQALKVLHDVCAYYHISPDDKNAPKLIMDWDWLGHGGCPSIVWEEGDYEWAINFAGKRTFLGEVWYEPMTSWALSLYLAD